MVKAVRGAITTENYEINIKDDTIFLIKTILEENNIGKNDLISIMFSATKDINKAYPAKFVRDFGIENVPLFSAQEMFVENSLEKCIRVLIHFSTTKKLDEVKHIYLKDAKVLRPDLIDK